jgi:hypothetical protein
VRHPAFRTPKPGGRGRARPPRSRARHPQTCSQGCGRCVEVLSLARQAAGDGVIGPVPANKKHLATPRVRGSLL